MSLRVPQPSKRFLRAAATERDDLLRHRQRLEEDRHRLQAELRGLDDAIASLDDRVTILNQMLGGPDTARPGPSTTSEAEPPPVRESVTDAGTLSGPAIREAAVQILLRQPEYIEALHYRRWYDLLCDAGYVVAGKDPRAVFLTQITRSPVVRKATEAGVYEIDRQAPLRLRQRLDRLNAELQEVRSSPSSDAAELEKVRARRHDLDVAISQTERALEEALRVLRREDHGGDNQQNGAARHPAVNRTRETVA